MTVQTPALHNAAQMAREHPATFERPSERQLAKIKVGTLVKVAIRAEMGPVGKVERFWVEVTERAGRILTGRIDNDLLGVLTHGLKLHDVIQFHTDNVYAIYEDDAPSHSGAIR